MNIRYKELERTLQNNKVPFSAARAVELTHNMYQINIILPESRQERNILLKMDERQQLLKAIIDKNFQGATLRKTGGKINRHLFKC